MIGLLARWRRGKNPRPVVDYDQWELILMDALAEQRRVRR